jgi:DNA-binding NarL/FixJ family response regulator
MSDSLSVVIADDHPVFRSGLRALLSMEANLEVVGEADNGAAVIELVERLQPDVVVMDLHMPDTDGVTATRTIMRDSPHVSVLVLTMFDDDDSVFAAMRAGARGYLLKGSNQAELVRAVQVIGSGGAVFGPAVAAKVMDYFARRPPSSAFPQLTEREHEILDLLAGGLNNARIAARVHITDKTVRNHVSNILTKLAVSDRAQAIVRAREAGLGSRPSQPGSPSA